MSGMAAYPDLSGQHVFITGAARGLGRSVAEKLAGCGATVAVTDIDGSGCDEVAKGICAMGGTALAYLVDVAVRDEFMQAAARFAEACGRIDAVVNNAMLLRYEAVEKITPETLNRMTAIGINGSVWARRRCSRTTMRLAAARSSTWPHPWPRRVSPTRRPTAS